MAARPGHCGDAGGECGHGLGHGAASAVVAVWPAVAVVGSYELLMVIICGVQVPADVPDVAGVPDRVTDADRLQVQAAQEFAAKLATGRVPSVRAAGTGPTWPP
ncbi:MAG: hypothetical protein WA817_19350 [Candidatus Acidiferrum sp.]